MEGACEESCVAVGAPRGAAAVGFGFLRQERQLRSYSFPSGSDFDRRRKLLVSLTLLHLVQYALINEGSSMHVIRITRPFPRLFLSLSIHLSHCRFPSLLACLRLQPPQSRSLQASHVFAVMRVTCWLQRGQCNMVRSRGTCTVSRDMVARTRRVCGLLPEKIGWVDVSCRQSWSEHGRVPIRLGGRVPIRLDGRVPIRLGGRVLIR
jgi:hypothetical protein